MYYKIVSIGLCALLMPTVATANALGENGAWQFEKTADAVNRAYLEDLRRKQNAGYYNSPVYTTNVDRQYNCSIASTATGNAGNNSTVANTPSASGHNASAFGNDSSSWINTSGSQSNPHNSNLQTNTGNVSSGVSGHISTGVSNSNSDSYQALNSTQKNSGNQSADVSSSHACTFSGAQ